MATGSAERETIETSLDGWVRRLDEQLGWMSYAEPDEAVRMYVDKSVLRGRIQKQACRI